MSPRPTNAFLSNLDEASFAAIEPHLVPVDLPFSATLHSDGDKIEWVYFPLNSLISLIVRGRSGSVEASLVGNESGAGMVEACGGDAWSVDVMVQVGGEALKCRAKICADLAITNPSFAKVAWRAAALQIEESRQSAYCQANHTLEQRLARWVLESMERSGHGNPLPVTQEFLGDMLGVRRTTVTGAALELKRAKIVDYHRGSFEVFDFKRLEAHACECRTALVRGRKRLHSTAFVSEPPPPPARKVSSLRRAQRPG